MSCGIILSRTLNETQQEKRGSPHNTHPVDRTFSARRTVQSSERTDQSWVKAAFHLNEERVEVDVKHHPWRRRRSARSISGVVVVLWYHATEASTCGRTVRGVQRGTYLQLCFTFTAKWAAKCHEYHGLETGNPMTTVRRDCETVRISTWVSSTSSRGVCCVSESYHTWYVARGDVVSVWCVVSCVS